MDRIESVVQQLRAAAMETPPPEPTKRRVGRRTVILGVGGAVAVVAIAAMAAGLLLRPATPPTVVDEAAPAFAQRSGKWDRVIARIDALRMQALVDDDPAALLLAQIYDSPAQRDDLRLMTQLRMQDVTLDHNPLRLVSVEEVFTTLTGDPQRARLRVVDTLEAYALVNDSGTVVSRHAGRGQRSWFIDLQRKPHGSWRMTAVSPADSRPSAQASRQGL